MNCKKSQFERAGENVDLQYYYFYFLGRKQDFSLDAAVLFSIKRDNSGNDGHVWSLYTFLLKMYMVLLMNFAKVLPFLISTSCYTVWFCLAKDNFLLSE